MQRKTRISLILFCIMASVCRFGAPFTMAGSPLQTSDEVQIRAAIEQFFAAYQKQDIDGLLSLWNKKSPYFDESKKNLKEALAGVQRIEPKSLEIKEVGIEPGGKTARALATIHIADLRQNDREHDGRTMERSFRLVLDSGTWKIWRYSTMSEDLAYRIGGAQTEEQRKNLLDANKELATPELSRALFAEGEQVRKQKDLTRAMSIFQLSLELARRLGDKPTVADSYRGIAAVHLSNGRAKESLEYCQMSYSMYEQIGDLLHAGNMVYTMGLIHHRQGNYSQALEFYHASLKIRETIGDKLGAATTLNNLGVLHQEQGNYAEALKSFERSLKAKREIGDRVGIAATINNVGLVEWNQGDYSRALESFQESLRIKQEMGDKAGASNSLTNIGIIYMDQGNYLKALSYYQAAAKLDAETGDKDGFVRNSVNISLVHFSQGNYTRALSSLERCLKISQEVGDKPVAANTLKEIGKVECAIGNYVKALESEHASLETLQQIGDREGTAQALQGLGDIEKSRGNYGDALDYYQRSLRILEDLGNRSEIAWVRCTIGEVFNLQGMYRQAIEQEEVSASLAQELGLTDLIADSLTAAGVAYEGTQRFEEARNAYVKAIGAVEQIRGQIAGAEQERQLFLERKIAPFYGLVDLDLKRGDAAAALAVAEQAKARTLVDVLSSGKIAATKAMTAAEREREQDLDYRLASVNAQVTRERLKETRDENRLADLNSQLGRLRGEFEGFLNDLYAAHPELETQRGHFKVITPEGTGALIEDSRTAVLEFAVSEEKTFLFSLTKREAAQVSPDIRVRTIDIKRKDLDKLVEKLRSDFAVRDAAFVEADRKLYDLLLKPAAAELRGKTNLIIVPDGPLWDLPFQALMPAAGRFLIQDCAISYAPSLTALREMSKPRRNAGKGGASTTLLALGNPDLGRETSAEIKQAFMDAELQPLPDAEQQVETLRALYGAGNSKVYVGAAATEDKLKAEAASCRILHLATHGIVNNASPMYSQVVLAQAPGSSDDGLLEAWEVMNLDLNADLVVLAACQTARGRYGAGEGMIGLSWAFFVAGCPTTVVSQWDVFAPSTTDLMIDFHRNLKAGMTKAESLRQAELKMLKSSKYAHPFYWAPFVVTGAAGRGIQ